MPPEPSGASGGRGRGSTVEPMGLADGDVTRVVEATDMLAVVGGYTELEQHDRIWVGPCPFDQEADTRSFCVNPREGKYVCFGCQANGDVVNFVSAIEHLGDDDAVRWLAARAGITL
jgi:DNA primase